MFGLTSLGIVHTTISMAALVSGVWALARDKEITTRSPLGLSYLVTTLLAALTALGIFQHGGFGPPHALAVLTLAALALGCGAAFTTVFGRYARFVQAICFTTTLLFHLIPGFTETLTRLPATQPLFPNAEAPGLRPIYGALLLAYAAGLVLQLRWLKQAMASAPAHRAM